MGCVFDCADNYSISIQPLNKNFINQQPNLEEISITKEKELRFYGYNKY